VAAARWRHRSVVAVAPVWKQVVVAAAAAAVEVARPEAVDRTNEPLPDIAAAVGKSEEQEEQQQQQEEEEEEEAVAAAVDR